jgi:hypothetical protein
MQVWWGYQLDWLHQFFHGQLELQESFIVGSLIPIKQQDTSVVLILIACRQLYFHTGA